MRDAANVRFWDGWKGFSDDPIPQTVEGYLEFLEREVEFVGRRNGREDTPEGFLRSIESIPGTLLDMTYEETWDYIRERGGHSIEPHTNINISLRKIMGK